MQIEITGELEAKVVAVMATQSLDSPEEAIAWLLDQRPAQVGAKRISLLPKQIDIEQLAKEQGVGPIEDFRDLKYEGWPDDESADEFLAFLDESRGRERRNGR